MSTAGPGKGAIRAQLGAALDEQIRKLDVFLGRTWQLGSAFGIFGGLALSSSVDGPLGITATAVSGAFFAFFTLYVALLEKGVGVRTLPIAAYVFEGSIPWIFFLVLIRTQGAAYALGSWVPPLLVGVLIITATARLRPLAPLLLGFGSGLLFLAAYWLVARPELTPEQRAMVLFGSTMQWSRATSLALGGILSALVARKLRDVIGRAERAVREQDLFGKYRLETKIASGGMGVVHRATYCPEGGFERVVAVKLLHPHLAEEESFLAAFRREAEISARLVHPNIVQVLDFGRAGDAYFLAMEYVDGLTFASLVKRLGAAQRKMPPSVAAYVGCEILSGLVYSHTGARDPDGTALRIIHRDLCPANILCSKNGAVKIADFGIARALRDTDTTRTRTVAGHLGYMAPEQIRAEFIDERWDIFAVGVTLWELLANRQLFNKGNEAQTLLAIMAGDVPDITTIRPDVDARWNSVLKTATAADPKARFASAKAMLDAIEQLPEAKDLGAGAQLAELAAWAMEQPDPPRAPEAETEIVSSSDREAETRVMSA